MSLSAPTSSLRGIALVLFAYFLFAWMDAASKHLAQTYPVAQIIWVRFGLFALFAVAFNLRGGLRRAFASARPLLQIGRGLLLVTEIGIFVTALRHMGIAEIHAIVALTPLMVTALSVPLLGERVGPRRWAAVAAGFVGMLIVVRPGLGVMHPAAPLALLSTLMFALYQVMTRMVAADGPRASTLYIAVTGGLALSLVGPFVWVGPDAAGWSLLALSAALGAAGHVILINALRLAPASTLQPFTYSAVVWATPVGFVVFGELPDGPTVAGAAVIVASGLYALYRERARAPALARGRPGP
jgi:drug/metabolite transporter (DMT)-like permease